MAGKKTGAVAEKPPGRIKIVEVGPRDGLQFSTGNLPPSVRATLVDKLAAAGLDYIETGSFVSPQWVPQMAGSDQVFQQIKRLPGVVYSAIVPNVTGLEQALAAGAGQVAVFTSASEGFCQKNINCSIDESLKRFEPVIARAHRQQVPVRGYVSCIVSCPYDGPVRPEQVVAVCQALWQMGCHEIALGDTLGTGTPRQLRQLFAQVADRVPRDRLAAHFHNTYGQALANLYGLIEDGLTVIDAAVAGLGGCPYAPGASGNVATEDVVYMLDGLGIATGIDSRRLLSAADYICAQLGLASRSSVGQALSGRSPGNP